MTDLIAFFRNLINSIVSWFLQLVTDVATWFLDLLQSIAHWIYQGVMDALATVIEAIPAPSFLESSASVFSAVPSSVVYLVSVAEFQTGLGIVGSAYLIRFLIRRLPVVG